MKRLLGLCLAAFLCVALPATAAPSLEDQVREAASLVYIHGMNDELAHQQIPPDGVPYLVNLLWDEEFTRRDNVVAFLAFLADDSHTATLLAYLDNPIAADTRPEDHRARLLIPTALGLMAQRGHTDARAALNLLGSRTLLKSFEDSDLRQTIDQGLELSVLAAVPASAQPAGADQPLLDGQFHTAAPTGGAHTNSTESDDTDPNIEQINITAGAGATGATFANHPDNNVPMTAERADELLNEVHKIFAKDDTVSGLPDTGCCMLFDRVPPAKTFGTTGDGLDVITTNSELNQVIGNITARFKVVDALNYCGGFDVNIIGCGLVGGDGIVVERLSGDSAFIEGLLWIHEFGHNVGLNHNASGGYIMSASLSVGNHRLTTFECSKYHNPNSGAHLAPFAVGVCQDTDNDAWMSSMDNCPTVPNSTQENTDTDFHGDACDNCPSISNPNQANCDNDAFGDVCDASSLPPGAIGPIGFTTKVQLSWPAMGVSKRIYRGAFFTQPFAFNNHVSIGTVGNLTNNFTDSQDPQAGECFYYLVKGFNGCGEGP